MMAVPALDPRLPPVEARGTALHHFGSDRLPIGGSVFVGVATVVLGIAVFAAWSTLAPLSGAAIAPGVIVVDSNRKVVQNVEGGAIAELLVREGDRVAKGQVIVRLDDLESKSTHEVLDGRFLSLSAQRARLLAERDEEPAIILGDEILRHRDRASVAEMLRGQQRIFNAGQEALRGQVDVLRARIAGFKAQAAALESQLKAGRDQLLLIEEELVAVRDMVARGLERRPRMLALERTAASIQGQQGDLRNRIAQTNEAIAGIELEIMNARRTRTERAAIELRDVETQLVEVEQKLATARIKLARRDVVAPHDGTVLDLQHHTIGAVVPPGGRILDIVPAEDRLIVEARVKPSDIDVVHAAMPAKVALTAFKNRTTPQLTGRVLQVSADALADNQTSQQSSVRRLSAEPAGTYYIARIEIDKDQLSRLDGVELTPGMPAEVFIETGERTLASYLMQPITDSFRRAFREQ